MAKPVTPRFSRSFRRLCQVAAVAGSDRLQHVVDRLLPVVMVYDTKTYRTTADWANSAHQLFELALEHGAVEEAVHRAVTSGHIIYNAQEQSYELSDILRDTTIRRIDESEKLETESQESWLAEVEPLVPDIGSDNLWNCLLTYSGEMFLRHGYDAVALLANEAVSSLGDDNEHETSLTSSEALYKAINVAGIDQSHRAEIATAIAVFFDGNDTQRVRYVTELVDSTFNFMTLGIDNDTRAMLVGNLPNLSIFIDTNIIFDIIGAHEARLSASSVDLLETINRQKLPFRLYCHEKTLQEVDRTIGNIGDWLREIRWTPALSRAVLASAYGEISSVEIKYHQTNSKVPTPPDVFLGRYSSMPALLAEYGVKIYRDPTTGTAEFQQKRGELTTQYVTFMKRGHHKPNEAIDHDVTLWLACLSRRTPTSKGPLFSGALILSADYFLRRFEREILTKEFGHSIRMVTEPGSMLQALRPFVSQIGNYDSAFVRLFATPEFRALGGRLGQRINEVAAYLATYDGMPEEIAKKILTNDMLMSRLRKVEKNSSEFRQAVDEALMKESEAVIRERDELLHHQEAVAEDAEAVQGKLSAIISNLPETGLRVRPDEARSVTEQLEEIREMLSQVAAKQPNINVVNQISNVASSGGVSIELAVLPRISEGLEEMRLEAIKHAKTAEDYVAIADIVSAKDSAEQGDSASVVRYLRKLGKKALDLAQAVGADVITGLLEHKLGIMK
jgi:uncharacterized protein YoxC